MKLMEILINELPSLGGWPDGVGLCTQEAGGTELLFFGPIGDAFVPDVRGIFASSICEDGCVHMGRWFPTGVLKSEYDEKVNGH